MAQHPDPWGIKSVTPVDQDDPWGVASVTPIAATPQTGNTGIFKGLQDSFDKNTTTSPNDPLLETGLKSVVHGAGSMLVHPLDAVESLGQAVTTNPMTTLRGMGNEAQQEYKSAGGGARGLGYVGTKAAGNLLGNIALGGAAGSAPGAVGDAIDMIPTRAKGGRMLDSVMQFAKDQPVTISPQTMAPLERTQQLALAGGKPFGAADKLFQRIQSVNPLTYGEARDFSSNLSLSPEEKMGLKKSMKYEVPQLSKAFGNDIGRAAEDAGVGPEYLKGMSTYRNGARLEDAAKNIAKYGGRAGLGAIGAGGLYELKKALF